MNRSESTIAPGRSSVNESREDQNLPPSDEQLWTSEQVGKYLHVSLKTVFNLRRRGLPYFQLGGAVRFLPQEIKDYLVANRGLTAHRLRQSVRKQGSK